MGKDDEERYVVFRAPLRELRLAPGEPLRVRAPIPRWVIVTTGGEKSMVLPLVYEDVDEMLEQLRAWAASQGVAAGDRPREAG